MYPTYKRTQPGTAMMVAVAIALALEALTAAGRPISPITVAVSALLLSVGIVFSTMTVAVNEHDVEWWFTLGLLRQRLALSQIDLATSERVTFLNGLGIRTNGRNWLWIVGGSGVVSFALRDGRKISIGSPEAQYLANLVGRKLTDGR